MNRALSYLRRRPSLWLLGALLLLAALGLWSAPPSLPSYADIRTGWRSSEAWLRDRDGRLLDTVRVDFAVRRLPWVPLERISPALREVVVSAEDRRFAHHHGIDWRGLAGSGWAALHGRAARGASTISMQLAAYLAR